MLKILLSASKSKPPLVEFDESILGIESATEPQDISMKMVQDGIGGRLGLA